MKAADFIELSKDPNQWRKHSRALRRSALTLWLEFERTLLTEVGLASEKNRDPDLDEALELFENTKLLYGLALETALKGYIIKVDPDSLEIRVTMNGRGEPLHAELRNVGVPTSQGHNLLALAEKAGIFGPTFEHVLKFESDRAVMRSICKDLGEVVLWRGRYPVPLASFTPAKHDPSVPGRALAHYIRDWLDPLLDALLIHDPGNGTSNADA